MKLLLVCMSVCARVQVYMHVSEHAVVRVRVFGSSIRICKGAAVYVYV